MKTNKGDAENMIVSELLSYLTEHPQAQDTLEGIANWWLLEQEITRRITEVKSALETLVTDEFVVEIQGEDGRTHYRINQEKEKEIKAFLKDSTKQDG